MSIRRGRSAAVVWSVFFDAESATSPILGAPTDNSGPSPPPAHPPHRTPPAHPAGRRKHRTALPRNPWVVQGSKHAATRAAPVRTLEGERDGDQAAHR
ncbi:hypothetical protein Slala04_19010 [Streptomyces lavendulae subsp. lavendulae]|nr:hypothetical protein Slala04_19010 [Streptomyces lavendulae subsp. lavendulae]